MEYIGCNVKKTGKNSLIMYQGDLIEKLKGYLVERLRIRMQVYHQDQIDRKCSNQLLSF